jgi:exopolysaccharide production protein ExoQ
MKIGQLTSEGINEAHNGYLEIYLNLGWAGIALLGLVILTGFPKVLRALRLDTESGKLMLAYFILGLIYNFTEAGFKMMNPVWIFFLLAIMAVPNPVSTEASPLISVKHLRRVIRPEPRVAQVTRFKACREKV